MSEKLLAESEPKKLKIKNAPLVITEHAMLRFQERWQPLDEWDYIPENDQEWNQKIENIARSSAEIAPDPIPKVRRMISNDIKNARYFYNKNYHLVFIIFEDDKTMKILTVEVPSYIKDKSGKHLEDI